MEENYKSLIEEMENLLPTAKADAVKFEKGNKSAGTRVRVAMQELKVKAQAVRIAIKTAKA